MNYTKGEWTTRHNIMGERIVVADNKELVAKVPDKTNAHLIAAAAEMYEALKALLPYAEGNPLVVKDDVEKGKQALAKAEGKSEKG